MRHIVGIYLLHFFRGGSALIFLFTWLFSSNLHALVEVAPDSGLVSVVETQSEPFFLEVSDACDGTFTPSYGLIEDDLDDDGFGAISNLSLPDGTPYTGTVSLSLHNRENDFSPTNSDNLVTSFGSVGTSNNLQEASPKPAGLGPHYTENNGSSGSANVVVMHFSDPVTDLGFFIGDVETSPLGAEAFIETYDLSGNGIESTILDTSGENPNNCGSGGLGGASSNNNFYVGCGNKTTRWIAIHSSTPVAYVTITVGDDDIGDNGHTEHISLAGVTLGGQCVCNDSDSDGICDSNDQCPGFDDGIDSDGDTIPDGCDMCPSDTLNDSDNDGICDSIDVCQGSDDSIDNDNDGTPDGCDYCPYDTFNDIDNDGVCGDVDICSAGDDAIDLDNNGTPDACDVICGDSDNDGTCNASDICPGFDDTVDTDGDATPDECDICPLDVNNDSDGDGICDSVDQCVGGDDSLDSDNDGVCDHLDRCASGDDTIDSDANGVPDACDLPLTPTPTFNTSASGGSGGPQCRKYYLNQCEQPAIDNHTGCTIGTYGNSTNTPTNFRWSCSLGGEKVYCEIPKFDDCSQKQTYIGGMVFWDENENGIKDVSEYGIEDVTIELLSAGENTLFGTDDDIVDYRLTDETGRYGFGDLQPGNYRVSIEIADPNIPAGSEATTQLIQYEQLLTYDGYDGVNFGVFREPEVIIQKAHMPQSEAPRVKNIAELAVLFRPEALETRQVFSSSNILPEELPETGFDISTLQSTRATKDMSYWQKHLREVYDSQLVYIVIPRLKIVAPIGEVTGSEAWGVMDGEVFDGDLLKHLESGVVHYPGTRPLGHNSIGNSVIFGHSSYYESDPGRYKDVFAQLPDLHNHELILVFHPSGNVDRYYLTVSEEISATDVGVLQGSMIQELTLLTCYPVGTTDHRWQVRAVHEQDMMSNAGMFLGTDKQTIISKRVSEWFTGLPDTRKYDAIETTLIDLTAVQNNLHLPIEIRVTARQTMNEIFHLIES